MALDKAYLEKELTTLLSDLHSALQAQGASPQALSRLDQAWPSWQVSFGQRQKRKHRVWQLVFFVREKKEGQDKPTNRVLISLLSPEKAELERVYRLARQVKTLYKLLSLL
ncbi:MAG TPA: hypothetical protein ENJ72_04010 [Thermodesulfatator sp.]|nr:hypothetical protein [Thermodesulfatator sp.]